MGKGHYRTMLEALEEVGDARKRRGVRYPWRLPLALIDAAMVAGNKHGRAIGRWVREHSDTLGDLPGWEGKGLPSESTLRRVLSLETLWRGHWGIENRVHHVRDVSLGEDAGQVRTGSTPQALAALRNSLFALMRHAGWTSIADALRHYAAHPDRALALVGALPTRL
jgi:hypothetical protein